MSKRTLALLLVGLLLSTTPAGAAELILPQNRHAFYCDEPIELAVAGLGKEATALVEFAPAKAGARLARLRAWLDSHQDQVIIAVFLLLGFWLAGESIYLLVS